MKWLECVKEISISGKPGKCPHCKGDNTDHAYVLIDKDDGVGYLEVWCNDCKKKGHISRVIINDKMKKVIDSERAEDVIPKYKVTY